MWILPSCGRPEKCAAVVKQLAEMKCSTPGVVIVNGSDQAAEYQAALNKVLPSFWCIRVLPENLGVCGALRWAFREFPQSSFYGLICDDEFVMTPGWDMRLINAAGDWCLAHGNNGDSSARFPHGFMTFGGELVRFLGNLAPPEIWHAYFDNYWSLIAEACGIRRFCEDVIIDERHPRRGHPEDAVHALAGIGRKEAEHWFTKWRMDKAEAGADALCRRITQEIRRRSAA